MSLGRILGTVFVVLVLIPAFGNYGLVDGPEQNPVVAPSGMALERPERVAPIEPAAPSVICTDSPTGNDGNPLNECQGTSFTLGGHTWDLSVYYTLDTDAGNDWINNHAEAAPIAGWMQDAFEAYYAQTGLTYGESICGRHIRAKILKGDGWSGIAYWPNSCYIGLHAPMIRGGGGRSTTMHEIRHKIVQFAYPNCLSDWKGDYPGNTTYLVEGDADYGPSTVGDFGYMNSGYSPSKSLQEHGYNNLFAPYYTEHVDLSAGPWGAPGDFDYLAGGMVAHWEKCETLTDLHVVRDVVESLTMWSMEEFFLNFFAALYLHSYADPATQPDLYFFEEDAPGVTVTFSPPLQGSQSLSGGSHSWTSQTTPDTWAGKFYEIQPQAGCEFVMLEGSGSGSMGWAFMAADTGAPTAEYSGWVGSEFSRVFAGHNAHDKIGVAAVAFGNNRTYDLTATCITPDIEIERPLKPNFVAYVGDPLSPVGFLGSIEVTDGSASPVTGIPADWFELDAEGDVVTGTAIYEITKGHYLGIFMAPSKAAGTSWVDLQACLGPSGACDTNSEALLYVPPGNMDMLLLHDASGSMGTVDVPGDYPRLEQAKQAAELLVMLAQAGDYYGIMDFSTTLADRPGEICPPGCVHDVNLVYPKTEITDPTTQIPAMRAAIGGMTDREWTNLGEGLRRAQTEILGSPASDNNKVVTVLSDGEENVTPMYDDMSSELEVVVNTMGFSGDAPNELLARIATENGGDFLYVPTTAGGAQAAAGGARREEMVASLAANLVAEGVPSEQVAQVAQMMSPASTYLPGGLALREAYDYRQADATGASRVAYNWYVDAEEFVWKVQSSNVSAADTSLTLVSSSREPDFGNCGWLRDVEVLVPGAGPRDWIPISPPGTIPGNWDVRNSPYSDVLIVRGPDSGQWQIRTRMRYDLCGAEGGESPAAPGQLFGNFIQTGKVLSTINLEGEILLENNQGKVGDPVPLLATVLTRAGATPGALVVATVERPGADAHLVWLRDDGEHGDGAAGDGIYANTYAKAVIGGAYNVTIGALGYDPFNPAQLLLRVWKGSFTMEGPGPSDDEDDDRIPTWWEKLYPCMDPGEYDSGQVDYDNDDLTNWREWQNGTDPCDPDTDDGGEMDGSEVTGQRNPHWPGDDVVRPIWDWSVRPLNQAVLVRWSHPFSYTRMHVAITPRDGRTETFDGGRTGAFTVGVDNDTVYTVTLQGETETGTGGPTAPETVVPKADPDPPSGDLVINSDVVSATTRAVEINVNASDEPIDGMPSQPSGAVASQWTAGNEVSGEVEMRFRNENEGEWTAWQPYTDTIPWMLADTCLYGTNCTVYGQFRDAAKNESLLVSDSIALVGHEIFLPLILRH